MHHNISGIRDFLRSTRIFQGLEEGVYRRVGGMAKECFFSRGEMIFDQGDPSDAFLILRDGFVKILRESSAGRSSLFELLGPGDLVGVVALLKSRPFPARALAATSCTLISIPASDFLRLKNDVPQIMVNFSNTMGDRLLNTREMRLHNTDSVEVRITQVLLSLSKKIGKRDGPRLILPRIFTRQDVADMVGSTVETTIRILSSWKKDGFFEETEAELIFDLSELENRS